MFWIVGGREILVGLAALIGCSDVWWVHQLDHVKWHGFAFFDMIFPLFLFIAGISFPFSLEKNLQKNGSRKSLYLKVIYRGFLLVLLGVIYNGLLYFDFANLRYASVLGRIGLAWMCGALIFMNTKTFTARGIWCAGLLIFYWLLLTFIPAPDYPDAERFAMEGNFTSYFDRLFLPGKLLQKIHDPEGILGLILATATALLGMLTGQFVKTYKDNLNETKKTIYMLIAGVGLVLIGLLWDMIFPINKNLWTSSFACYVSGLSLLLFAVFYFIIDVHGYRKWSFFFIVIGLNSITIYMANRMIDFVHTAKFIFGGTVNLFPEAWMPMLSALFTVTVCWVFLYVLYRKKIFLKV
jgi:predicted acyltransferase